MSDLSLFFGAFHPIIVHLPIGVLLVAGVLHLLSLPGDRLSAIGPALPWLYGFALLGSLGAVLSGWALAGPLGASWDTHRYFGLGALVLVGFLFWLSLKPASSKLLSVVLVCVTLGIVGWTGHLGGALTHGEGHFEQYAPDALRAETDSVRTIEVVDPEAVVFYETLVQPIFQEKCIDCHRAGFARGQLRMDSYAALAKGGREGAVTSLSGELWNRITLPASHPRFMPTRGEVLDYAELQIVKAWLASAKDSTSSVADLADGLGEDDYAAIEQRYFINARPLPYIERANPPALEVDLTSFTAWKVERLSQQHTTLVAKLLPSASNAEKVLTELKAVAPNLVILKATDLKDGGSFMQQLPMMPHIVDLDMSRSDISDEDLSALEKYPHLERLVLYGTQVTAEGIASLQAELPDLEKVYY